MLTSTDGTSLPSEELPRAVTCPSRAIGTRTARSSSCARSVCRLATGDRHAHSPHRVGSTHWGSPNCGFQRHEVYPHVLAARIEDDVARGSSQAPRHDKRHEEPDHRAAVREPGRQCQQVISLEDAPHADSKDNRPTRSDDVGYVGFYLRRGLVEQHAPWVLFLQLRRECEHGAECRCSRTTGSVDKLGRRNPGASPKASLESNAAR